MKDTIVFTSITKNYFAKAVVLANSIKRVNPSVVFHVVMAEHEPFTADDVIPDSIDSIITLSEFDDILDEQYLFMHSLVEVCTALKPLYLNKLLQNGWQKIHYFDPDMRVFSDISVAIDSMDDATIGLTPHITSPDFNLDSIMINEMSAAKHGVFNLGFLAIKSSDESKLFAKWWADRVIKFGFSETFMGSFTDQKVCDFAPCYFTGLKVLRHPGFNVAHWNLNDRQVKTIDDEIYVGASKLVFYHFSAYDSGIGRELIEERDANESATLLHIWDIYAQELQQAGEAHYSTFAWPLSTFNDGVTITKAMRLYYRQNAFVRQLFPKPLTEDSSAFLSFWHTDNMGAKLEAKLGEFEAQLKQYRYPVQQADAANMLSALENVDTTHIDRVFIYGANEYGEQVLRYCRLQFAQKPIHILDQNQRIVLDGQSTEQAGDFAFSNKDLVVICGLAARNSMINTIQRLSDTDPVIV